MIEYHYYRVFFTFEYHVRLKSYFVINSERRIGKLILNSSWDYTYQFCFNASEKDIDPTLVKLDLIYNFTSSLINLTKILLLVYHNGRQWKIMGEWVYGHFLLLNYITFIGCSVYIVSIKKWMPGWMNMSRKFQKFFNKLIWS